MQLFNFAPNSRLIKEIAPEEQSEINMNGWQATVKPTDPYRRSFSVKLEGMRWYLSNGVLDLSTDTEHNVGRLWKFYQDHRLYSPFLLNHEYLGQITCRFKNPLTVNEAMPNSDGLVESIELMLIHHNPGY